jgi:transcription elongation factor Elf1
MTKPASRPLPPDRIKAAMKAIWAWRADANKPVACPVCGAGGLVIVDRSARPHAEWYNLSCQVCGLEHVLHIPMSTPIGGSDI